MFIGELARHRALPNTADHPLRLETALGSRIGRLEPSLCEVLDLVASVRPEIDLQAARRRHAGYAPGVAPSVPPKLSLKLNSSET